MKTPASALQLYDTTLRDGMQQEGIALTVADKLAVARALDGFGVTFIEGGWPGAIPRDTEFFRRARAELTLRHAQLVAFGATRRPDAVTADDPQIRALLDAETPAVTLVAKADARHVEAALRTSLAENLAMIRDSVSFFVGAGRRVFLDAEHFFDGYRRDPAYALEVVRVAAEAGAEVVALCDTNGGTLPDEIADVVAHVAQRGVRLGIHCHDDAGCAVANSLLAIEAGAVQVQGTAHGYGERCGNANLFTVVGNLELKKGATLVPSLASMTEVAATISAITAAPRAAGAPYVGRAAFTHKAGLHASAVRIDPGLYQHADPKAVGNGMRTLVSDQGGRSSVEMKARELGHDVPAGSPAAGRIARRVKDLERAGYSFETADASLELIICEELSGGMPREFAVESWRLTVVSDGELGVWQSAEVTVFARGRAWQASAAAATHAAAMHDALRAALSQAFADLPRWELSASRETRLSEAGDVRALLWFTTESAPTSAWSTVGVGRDAVVAAWRAIQDAADYVQLTKKRSMEVLT